MTLATFVVSEEGRVTLPVLAENGVEAAVLYAAATNLITRTRPLRRAVYVHPAAKDGHDKLVLLKLAAGGKYVQAARKTWGLER